MRSRHAFVFESQLFLHPMYKDLDDNLVKIVKYCCLQTSTNFVQCERIGAHVKDQVKARVRALMHEAQKSASTQILEELDRSFEQQVAGELSTELMNMYASVNASVI
ncbi:hypothetical protein PINS_up002920 [Pythium insidiosum]|nr:hypothetical protein PINS_up002920 [Pythium insidiosum]